MSAVMVLDRPKYRPSGKVAVIPFLVSALALFPVALLMGALLSLSGQLLYIVIGSPVIAAGAVAGAGYLLMRASHCRSPVLAGWMLAGMGIVMYLFQFPTDVAIHFGPQVFLHPEIWPRIMVGTVNNWQFGQPGQGAAGNPVPVFNWIFFCVEMFVSALVAAVGAVAATPGYCERCGKWMTKKSVLVEPGGAQSVVQALITGNLGELNPIGPHIPNSDHGAFDIEGCSHSGHDAEATFYVSAREVRGKGDKQTIATLAQQSLLTPDEFLLLVEKCPSLAGK
jgi:hypothetical protein